ncbi:citrate transporter [Mycobacterium sp. djl-10]|nr:citrate transporter [Mycobacterium sp. djl-10]
MLALLGFSAIALFTVLVMAKKMSAVAALILIPAVLALIAGFGADVGDMMIQGIVETAPTAVFLIFALLYFLVMFECGLFEPFVRRILAAVGNDPVRIVVGTAVLIIVVGLDGDGATAALITISAMYPIYRRIGINPLIIAMLLAVICPVLNWMPWGGPPARMAISLNVGIEDIVVPMLPTVCLSLVAAVVFAYVLGRSERRRLRTLVSVGPTGGGTDGDVDVDPPRTVQEPRNFWFNLPLTLAVMALFATGFVPLPATAMAAFAIAVTVNFPNLHEQQERLKPHAGTVVLLSTLILAAGAFTGIMTEGGMVEAMANSIISVVPESWGSGFAFVTAVLSMPLLFVLSTDSFFLGVVPMLAHTAAAFGVPAEVIARAALIGTPLHSLSPLIAPIYFVATLLRTDIGSLQRYALPWTTALCLVALVGATITGAIYAA